MIATTKRYWRITQKAHFGNQRTNVMELLDRQQALAEVRRAHPLAPFDYIDAIVRDTANGIQDLGNGVCISRAP